VSDNVLDMIDHAVWDWESEDAMRWSPDPAPKSEWASGSYLVTTWGRGVNSDGGVTWPTQAEVESMAAAFDRFAEAARPIWDELARALIVFQGALDPLIVFQEFQGGRDALVSVRIDSEPAAAPMLPPRPQVDPDQRRRLLHGRRRSW
jgi:hypothetical protein